MEDYAIEQFEQSVFLFKLCFMFYMANKQTVDSPWQLIKNKQKIVRLEIEFQLRFNCIKLMSIKHFMTLPPFAISFADTKRNSNFNPNWSD